MNLQWLSLRRMLRRSVFFKEYIFLASLCLNCDIITFHFSASKYYISQFYWWPFIKDYQFMELFDPKTTLFTSCLRTNITPLDIKPNINLEQEKLVIYEHGNWYLIMTPAAHQSWGGDHDDWEHTWWSSPAEATYHKSKWASRVGTKDQAARWPSPHGGRFPD